MILPCPAGIRLIHQTCLFAYTKRTPSRTTLRLTTTEVRAQPRRGIISDILARVTSRCLGLFSPAGSSRAKRWSELESRFSGFGAYAANNRNRETEPQLHVVPCDTQWGLWMRSVVDLWSRPCAYVDDRTENGRWWRLLRSCLLGGKRGQRCSDRCCDVVNNAHLILPRSLSANNMWMSCARFLGMTPHDTKHLLLEEEVAHKECHNHTFRYSTLILVLICLCFDRDEILVHIYVDV